jgi:hypothetical protein
VTADPVSITTFNLTPATVPVANKLEKDETADVSVASDTMKISEVEETDDPTVARLATTSPC